MLAGAAVIAACSKTYESDPDAADAGAPEAGASTSDAAPGAQDSGPSTSTDGALPGFCAQTSDSFCADFDESADLGTSWDKLLLPTGDELEISNAVADSKPSALHAKITTANPTSVEKAITLGSKTIIALDVQFAALPTDTGVIAPVALEPADGTNARISFLANSIDAYFQVNDANNTATFSDKQDAPALNQWHHLQFTLTTAESQMKLDATLDGFAVWSTNVPFVWPSGTAVKLEVGIPGLFEASTGETFIDNVVVTPSQ